MQAVDAQVRHMPETLYLFPRVFFKWWWPHVSLYFALILTQSKSHNAHNRAISYLMAALVLIGSLEFLMPVSSAVAVAVAVTGRKSSGNSKFRFQSLSPGP